MLMEMLGTLMTVVMVMATDAGVRDGEVNCDEVYDLADESAAGGSVCVCGGVG